MTDHQRHKIAILLVDLNGQRSVPDFKTVSAKHLISAVLSSSLLASSAATEAEQRIR